MVLRALLPFLLFVPFLTACGPNETSEEIVARRVNERWEALVAKDLETAYSYLSPAYRQAVPVKRYRGGIGRAVVWLGAEAQTVKCEENVCDVKVLLTYRYNSGTFKHESSSVLDEKWISSEGNWWYFKEI